MGSAGGRVGATDQIPEVEMDVVEGAPEEPGRVGSKRVRDSPSALGSHGMALCSLSASACMHAVLVHLLLMVMIAIGPVRAWIGLLMVRLP